jgi:hypothetical protein
MSDRVQPGSRACVCEFPDECDGTGTLQCEWADAGDECECECGCRMPCPGCDECEDEDTRIVIDDYDGDERVMRRRV